LAGGVRRLGLRLVGGRLARAIVVRHEREQQHLVDGVDEVNRQALPQLVVEILLDVLLVLPRQDHFLDAGALGGQHLFLDAANRQHLALQRDLAGH
jgi:hypothetical protein